MILGEKYFHIMRILWYFVFFQLVPKCAKEERKARVKICRMAFDILAGDLNISTPIFGVLFLRYRNQFRRERNELVLEEPAATIYQD